MMTLRSLLILLLTPIAIALVHAVMSRLCPGGRQRIALISCGVGALAVTLTITVTDGAPAFSLPVSLLLAHVYFHLFNMSETARRIRLLVDLYEGRTVRSDRYDPGAMIRTRVERLVDLRQIERVGTRYRARRSWLWAAAMSFGALERLLFPRRVVSIASRLQKTPSPSRRQIT